MDDTPVYDAPPTTVDSSESDGFPSTDLAYRLEAAANMLLRGAAEDSGDSIRQMTEATSDWSRETIAAVQERLKAAGYYTSVVDGLSGPNFTAALETWRNGGFEAAVLVD